MPKQSSIQIPRPDSSTRGPWEYRDIREPTNPRGYILMPMILGGVVRIVRLDADLSLRKMATRLHVSPPVMTHIETGIIAMTAFYLEIIAAVLNDAIDAQLDRHPQEAWQAWELLRTAQHVANTLEDEGFVVYWSPPRPDLDPEQFERGQDLLDLIRSRWPDDYANRLRR